jgi:replicative DNA helicase
MDMDGDAASGAGMLPGQDLMDDPQIAIERTLLAALVYRPTNFDALPASFGMHCFVNPDHVSIFELAQELSRAGATRLAPLLEEKIPRLAGAKGYIRSLQHARLEDGEDDAKAYANALVAADQRRRLQALAQTIVRQTANPNARGNSATAIAARAMDELDGIVSSQRTFRDAVALSDAMHSAILLGEAINARGDGLLGLTTGLRDLDARTHGYIKGTMHVIGARPGMGKSSLAVGMAIAAAAAGKVVLFLSLEMPAEQLAQRALALISGVPVEAIMTGAYAAPAKRGDEQPSAAMRLKNAAAEMERLKIDIVDEPAMTPTSVRARIRSCIRKYGHVDEVWVDHIHLMGESTEGRKHGKVYATTENSNALLAIAKEFDVAMMVLAQLSRSLEIREDKRPQLSDLRESGAIEQDAFSVTFIYRDEYYLRETAKGEKPKDISHDKWREKQERAAEQAETAKGKAELIVAKIRMGKTGTVHLNFDGPRTAFYDLGGSPQIDLQRLSGECAA